MVNPPGRGDFWILKVTQGPFPESAARFDFGGLIADETEKWGKVIRAANIKPD